jgi:hypothetical protein
VFCTHATKLKLILEKFSFSFVTKPKKHGLRIFESGVLGKIFGPKRDKVIGMLIRLHNEQFHDPYCSPNIIPVIKSRRVWVGKLEGKRTLGRPRRRRKENTTMYLQEVGQQHAFD